jgi:beta-glucosidase/6-phospho-beta-glucosidase/beta-galactosidase
MFYAVYSWTPKKYYSPAMESQAQAQAQVIRSQKKKKKKKKIGPMAHVAKKLIFYS